MTRNARGIYRDQNELDRIGASTVILRPAWYGCYGNVVTYPGNKRIRIKEVPLAAVGLLVDRAGVRSA